jgi:ribosomal protein S6--L-glutamate ligase
MSRMRVAGRVWTRSRSEIGVLVEQRYLAQRQPAGLTRALRAAEYPVRVLEAETLDGNVVGREALRGLAGLIVRGRSDAVLGLLAVADTDGLATVNSRSAIAAVRDKVVMTAVLRGAGVPMPRTYIGHPLSLAAELPTGAYPVIVKPRFGDNGRGLRIVADAEALAGLTWPEPTALVQQYLPGHRRDLKLYGIRSLVAGVRKASPLQVELTGSEETPEAVALDADLIALGRRCGRLFGLALWGVDCLMTPAGPHVVDVNDFPNYTGVPGADEEMAKFVVRRLAEAR